MDFKLTKPCKSCPFRTDIHPFLNQDRAEEIARSLERATFPCHKTLDYDHESEDEEDCGEGLYTKSTQHCAGALIMLEASGLSSQMMRIAERLGIYDRTKLDMDAPVFKDVQEWIDAQDE